LTAGVVEEQLNLPIFQRYFKKKEITDHKKCVSLLDIIKRADDKNRKSPELS
jgi:hypothetical protein